MCVAGVWGMVMENVHVRSLLYEEHCLYKSDARLMPINARQRSRTGADRAIIHLAAETALSSRPSFPLR
jgi:hypothetical protein